MVMSVRVISSTSRPEEVIEMAYLSCRNIASNISSARDRKRMGSRRYTGSGERRANRIKSIFLSKHFSVLEHASATIQITGVSRTCVNQLVRHRVASYAQLSQRSVSHKDLKTIVPPRISADPDALAVYLNSVKKSRLVYDYLRGRKIPKQDARYVLPEGTESQIIVTMNFRSWIHFLRLRTNAAAQWEIRNLANEVWEELKKIAPNVFDEKYHNLWE